MKRTLFFAFILAALMTGCTAQHAHTEGDGHDHTKDGAKHKDEHAHTEGDGHDHSKDEPAKKEEKGK